MEGLIRYPGTVRAWRVFTSSLLIALGAYITSFKGSTRRFNPNYCVSGILLFSGKSPLRAGATWYRVKEQLPYIDLSKDCYLIISESILHLGGKKKKTEKAHL